MTSIARRAPAPRAVLAAVTALALASLPQRAVAAPAGEATPPADPSETGETTEGARPPDDRGAPPEESGGDADVAPVAPDTEPEPEPDPDVAPEAEPERDPDDAAVLDTGTLDDREPSTEPAAPDPVAAAEDDDDGASPPADDELPELSTLQKAGWWTLFGAFAVGTTAGVFAGLAERQEDRALRLATLFDSTTGAQPIYEDHRADYEQHLRRGRAFERTAIGLGTVTGAVLVAGIVLFAVDAARRRSGDADRRRAHVRPGLGGWQVRF
jgi:hypothetical protein